MKILNLILLIDDNEADNEYHQSVIRSAEITNNLVTITHSPEALKYLVSALKNEDSSSLPELIFLDINMPMMNGFELLDNLKVVAGESDRLKSIKIFMLTGSLNPDDFDRATTHYRDIVTGFRIKPLTDTVFLKIVQTYFPL